jgi:hypothetical protein
MTALYPFRILIGALKGGMFLLKGSVVDPDPRIQIHRIRIHQIHIFLGLPHPDPLVRGMDPDPDPSVIMQK